MSITRNARGDSAYLAPDDGPLAIRVSNHARTPRQRRNHPEIVTSLVLRRPKSPAQVEAMVTAALRMFAVARARAVARRSDEDAASGSENGGGALDSYRIW